MSVTQQDIANKVGVSRRAIGYALNGDNRVGKEMRERILAVAEELGYQTHLSAKALVTGRTYQVALCVPSLDNPYHAEFIRHFEAHTRHTPYQLLITTQGEGNGSLAQLNVDGLLMHGFTPSAVPSRPTVLLQSPPEGAIPKKKGAYDQVSIDMTQAAQDVMEHLLAAKPKRVVLITVGFFDPVSEPRSKAYHQGMKRAGLEPEVIMLEERQSSPRLRANTHQVVREYCQKHGPPDAFWGINDAVAIGVYRAMRELKLDIPRDVAVIGCDDIPETRDLWPPLTTIRHDWEKICQQAWEMLMSRIEAPESSPRKASCPSKFIVRGSTESELKGDL